MQTLQFFGDTDRNDREKKTGKGGKENGNLTRISFHPWPETAQQGRHRPAAGGGHCSDPAAVAGRHGHSGKWRKAERGCPAKPGGGHSGQYPGSAAHAGRREPLRQTAPAVRQGKAVEPTMRRLSRWNSSAPPGRQRGPIRSRRMTAA